MLRRGSPFALRALRALATRSAAGTVDASAARVAMAPAARAVAAPWAARSFASSTSDWDDEDDMVIYPDPAAVVGSPAPRFKAPAALGGEVVDVSLDQWLEEGKYVCLFFYPKVKGGGGGQGLAGRGVGTGDHAHPSPPPLNHLANLQHPLPSGFHVCVPHGDHRVQRSRVGIRRAQLPARRRVHRHARVPPGLDPRPPVPGRAGAHGDSAGG